MRIVLLGAPGAGKGTLCKRLVERYDMLHLSSGDILRRERAANSELGKKAQQFMDSGALVPDDLIVEMMAGAITKAGGNGFVLDGFPRTVNQAQELDKSLDSLNLKVDAVLNLKIEDQIIYDRMSGRRSCPECGAVYHIKNLKPKVEGKCDNDGTELIQRPDDNIDVVSKRLEIYHEQTAVVVDYYKNNGVVYDIDACNDSDNVCEIVFESLDKLSSLRCP